MSTDAEQKLEDARELLADASEMILQLFEDCPHCGVDTTFSSKDKKWFTFSREKNKAKKFLYVRVISSLEEFAGRDKSLNDKGLRNLEIRIDTADRQLRGSGMIVFGYSTAFGIAAVSGEYGVATQVRRWLNGFVREWVLQEKSLID